jgi:uncharacterized YkwD family protein
VVLTVIALAAGCSSNQAIDKGTANNQTRAQTHTGDTDSAKPLTRASSISTENGKDSSISIKQAPNNASNFLDWIGSNYPQAGSSAGQGGATGQPTAPQWYFTPQQPATPEWGTAPQQPATPQWGTAPQQPTTPEWGTAPQQPATPQVGTTPQQPTAPQQPATPQQPGDASQVAQQVLDLVNQERSKAGLSALSMNSSLSKMATDKAVDMINNNYFDHQSPTYGSPFDMMKTYGITYNAAGENIAKGQTSASEVMSQWMNSPGHRANILNGNYNQIGIGYYNSAWVQEFIGQ